MRAILSFTAVSIVLIILNRCIPPPHIAYVNLLLFLSKTTSLSIDFGGLFLVP